MNTLVVILPVFLVGALGYLFAAAGVFRREDGAGLTRFVFSFALPLMLFHSMATIELPADFRWSFFLAYYVPVLMVFAGGLVIGRRVFRHGRTERAVFAMGAAFSNTVLIGIPIVSAAWGDRALFPLLMIVSVHAAILFTITTVIAESGASRGARLPAIAGRTIRGVARNPILLGILAGLAANALAVPLPAVIEGTLRLIRGAAVPAALFAAGASLREYRIMGHIPEALTLLGLKLVVQPAAVWLFAAYIFDLPPLWSAVAVLTAALPTGVNVSVFARKYDAAIAPVVTATLASTLVSVVSLSMLITVLSP